MGMATGAAAPSEERLDFARRARRGFKNLKAWQQSMTAIADCDKPVIAAISGGCFGGGVDLISACDVRFCAEDAYFCIKEVDIGIPADVGTLQRLPRLVGNKSLCRELAFTGRNMPADEAKEFGLVSKVLPDRTATLEHALSTARTIAEKSPVAIVGIKEMLIYAEDHSVADGLNYVNVWNHGMGSSEDMKKA